MHVYYSNVEFSIFELQFLEECNPDFVYMLSLGKYSAFKTMINTFSSKKFPCEISLPPPSVLPQRQSVTTSAVVLNLARARDFRTAKWFFICQEREVHTLRTQES